MRFPFLKKKENKEKKEEKKKKKCVTRQYNGKRAVAQPPFGFRGSNQPPPQTVVFYNVLPKNFLPKFAPGSWLGGKPLQNKILVVPMQIKH